MTKKPLLQSKQTPCFFFYFCTPKHLWIVPEHSKYDVYDCFKISVDLLSLQPFSAIFSSSIVSLQEALRCRELFLCSYDDVDISKYLTFEIRQADIVASSSFSAEVANHLMKGDFNFFCIFFFRSTILNSYKSFNF